MPSAITVMPSASLERLDGFQDALASRAFVDVGDEGAVDLDLVGGDSASADNDE